MFGILIP